MTRRRDTPAQVAQGKRLASALRTARVRADSAQADLATRSGVSIDTIRKLERNGITAPSFLTVARLARQLDVPLDGLAEEVLDT